MKKVNIIYWIATGILLAMMLFSAVGTFMPANSDSVKMMDQMHYQLYLFHFLAVAKILGIIAILIPGFPRIKEWAYAGFTFDLIGAAYSMYVTGFPPSAWAMPLIFVVILAVSYIYYHKRLKFKSAVTADIAV